MEALDLRQQHTGTSSADANAKPVGKCTCYNVFVQILDPTFSTPGTGSFLIKVQRAASALLCLPSAGLQSVP